RLDVERDAQLRRLVLGAAVHRDVERLVRHPLDQGDLLLRRGAVRAAGGAAAAGRGAGQGECRDGEGGEGSLGPHGVPFTGGSVHQRWSDQLRSRTRRRSWSKKTATMSTAPTATNSQNCWTPTMM